MIRKVTIANLKAFGEEQSIALASNLDANVSKLTLLVGPNNSGKSTMISSLEEILTSPTRIFTAAKEHRHDTKQPVLTVGYGNHTISLLPSTGSKFEIDGLLDADRSSVKVVPSRRAWTELFHQAMEEGDYRNQLRSNRRSNRYYIDGQFGGALMKLSLDTNRRAEFIELLKRVDPSIQDWRTETSGGQDFIEYKADVGSWHRIGDVGDGVSSLFRICYELLHLKPEESLLIDEPELSLLTCH
jgi:energy-coupling factor transporter ATP-binding protein EcfA2